MLNALGLKASAVGNHEFDQGYGDLVDRVMADGTNAAWPYLGANVYQKGTKTPALDEYTILDVDGVKVAVVGAITQETPTLVSPAGIADLDFGDPVEAVNRVAAQLTDGDESNGEADVIVAEYHEGAGAGTPDGATLEQELAQESAFTEIDRLDGRGSGHGERGLVQAGEIQARPGEHHGRVDGQGDGTGARSRSEHRGPEPGRGVGDELTRLPRADRREPFDE